MVGGVLVERTVKEVVPALVNNRDKMEKLIETLNSQAERERRSEMQLYAVFRIRIRLIRMWIQPKISNTYLYPNPGSLKTRLWVP